MHRTNLSVCGHPLLRCRRPGRFLHRKGTLHPTRHGRNVPSDGRDSLHRLAMWTSFFGVALHSLTSAAYNSALTGTANAPTAAKTSHTCGTTGLSPHGVNMRACACRFLPLTGPRPSMRPSAIIQCAPSPEPTCRSRKSPVMYALAAAPAWPVRPWVLWSCLTEPCVGRQCLALGTPASSLGPRPGSACVAKRSCLQQESPSDGVGIRLAA